MGKKSKLQLIKKVLKNPWSNVKTNCGNLYKRAEKNNKKVVFDWFSAIVWWIQLYFIVERYPPVLKD